MKHLSPLGASDTPGSPEDVPRDYHDLILKSL